MAKELTRNTVLSAAIDEVAAQVVVPAESGGDAVKKSREGANEEDSVSKRQRVDGSLKEGKMDDVEGNEKIDGDLEVGGDEGEKEPVTVSVGPKLFNSSIEMFDYFLKLLRIWSLNLNINEYEHIVLLDLLKKGHPEPAKKIGEGIEAFQVRYHPSWKSRCFFLTRVDGTTDDFSFRKCVDNILPLPDHMNAHSTQNDAFENKHRSHQSGQRGGGRRGGRGHGRRGGFRK